jgi:type I restriction enzyme S subunit
MMRLPIREDLILPEYLELYLQSSTARRQIISIAAGTSASMKKINKTNLQQISILLPSLDIQRKLVNIRKQIVLSRLSLLERLSKSKYQHLMLLNYYVQ